MGDRLGGILLLIGAVFYCLNIIDTYNAQGTVGVSLLWAAFFVMINLVYTYIFYKSKLMRSFVGSGVLFITEGTWLGMMIYYGGVL